MSTIVITGANRGIGLELCKQLAGRGDTVIAVCRNPSPELEELANGERVCIESGVDVTSDDDVGRLAGALGDRRIDVLINNAGLLRGDSFGSVDLDAVRRQFEVNALGPLRVTQALAPLISDGGKVAIVTSRMGSIADNSSGGSYGYRMSKAAVNIAGASMAIDLAPRDIAVVLLHPGFVRTDMTGGAGYIDPPEAAANLIARIDDLTTRSSGSFFHASGEQLPW